MDLTGRRILVTGASSGIGRSTAEHLSRLGARIVLVARGEDRLRSVCAALEGAGHWVCPCDLRNLAGIHAWMKTVAEDGSLAGLVHCAGLQATLPLRYLNLERVEEMMRLNVTAALALAKAFRQKGVPVADSSIVFITSIAGIAGSKGLSAYCASKGALIAAVRALALELSPERIRVNCVAPGHVEDTGMAIKADGFVPPEAIAEIRRMHPLGTGRSLDVANAVAFLLADSGRWITGSTLVVDGGYTAA